MHSKGRVEVRISYWHYCLIMYHMCMWQLGLFDTIWDYKLTILIRG